MANIICFKSIPAYVLWKNEILGQLSDGHWENTRPLDHWRVWHDLVPVFDAEAAPGVHSRYPMLRRRYNLLNKDLIDAIGDRMAYAVALAQADSAGARRVVDQLTKLPDSHSARNNSGHYAAAAWEAAGLTRDVTAPVALRELKRVLREVKASMDTDVKW